jgi:2-C-methyl-D-erythritol 4-phosphate cytidylyltransferase
VRTAAVVPAAGRGERLGPGAPKALRNLAGQPLLVHAVRALADARSIDVVVVAAPEGEQAAVRLLLGPVVADTELVVVTGGDTRQRSVALALQALPDDVDVVLVHDAARPLVPSEVVDAVASAVRDGADAVVPGVAITDTIKQVDPAGRVERTVDRTMLRAAQTPQGFARIVLESAHRVAAENGVVDVTDDAGLVEQAGHQVLMIPGSEDGFKVTRPLDLVLAQAVLARRRSTGVH